MRALGKEGTHTCRRALYVLGDTHDESFLNDASPYPSMKEHRAGTLPVLPAGNSEESCEESGVFLLPDLLVEVFQFEFTRRVLVEDR